jgi:radical SAM protein with 4Fe4S-binding SPASM domain
VLALREAEIAKRYPRNPDACVLFGRCEYLPVCTGECSINDPIYRTAETEHEELRAA